MPYTSFLEEQHPRDFIAPPYFSLETAYTIKLNIFYRKHHKVLKNINFNILLSLVCENNNENKIYMNISDVVYWP